MWACFFSYLPLQEGRRQANIALCYFALSKSYQVRETRYAPAPPHFLSAPRPAGDHDYDWGVGRPLDPYLN